MNSLVSDSSKKKKDEKAVKAEKIGEKAKVKKTNIKPAITGLVQPTEPSNTIATVSFKPIIKVPKEAKKISGCDRESATGCFELCDYFEPINDEIVIKLKQQTPKTYRLEPLNCFRNYWIQSHLSNAIRTVFLTSCPIYDAEKARNCCVALATIVKNLAKAYGFDRYKFVSNVTVIQKFGQEAIVASRALWSLPSDSFSSEAFETATYTVICSLYACYHE